MSTDRSPEDATGDDASASSARGATIKDPVLLEVARQALERAPAGRAAQQALRDGEIGKFGALLRKRRRVIALGAGAWFLLYFVAIFLDWKDGVVLLAVVQSFVFIGVYGKLNMATTVLDALVSADH